MALSQKPQTVVALATDSLLAGGLWLYG